LDNLNIINSFIKIVDSVNAATGKFLPYVLATMMPIVTYEVIRRYLFNSPTIWGMESTTYLFCLSVALGGGWAYLNDAHVRVDILYDRLSPKGKAFMGLVNFPLMLLFLVGLVFASWKQAVFSISMRELSGSLWDFPVCWIKLSVFVGSVLLLLQAVTVFLGDLLIVLKKKVGNKTGSEGDRDQ
jgi:TRAP-type mannitol/chloroaromatic compound transport system permease small subunit